MNFHISESIIERLNAALHIPEGAEFGEAFDSLLEQLERVERCELMAILELGKMDTTPTLQDWKREVHHAAYDILDSETGSLDYLIHATNPEILGKGWMRLKTLCEGYDPFRSLLYPLSGRN